MKNIISTLLIIATLAFGFAFTACGNNSNSIKVGITYYAPMNYLDTTTNELVGFDTDFAKKALKEIGYEKIEFVEINWDIKQIALNTKEIDLIWNGMTIKNELKEYMAFTDSYMENKQVVVCKKTDAAKFTDVASIKASGAEVYVENGSAAETVCTENGITLTDAQKAGKQADCLLEVKAKTNAIAILDITLAKAMTGDGTNYRDLTFVDVGFAGEEYGIGVRKSDTELLEKLNAIIAKYKTDGTFDELIKKYMA